MDFSTCVRCGTEIEGKGIHFRGKTFCGDECCEEYEAEHVAKGEPGADDLTDKNVADENLEELDLGDDRLGYQDEEDAETSKFDEEDDYNIKPDDF